MTYQKSLTIVIFLLICIHQLSGQSQNKTIRFDVNFWGYADNREYKAPNTLDKTIIGTLISPTLQFQIEENHNLIGGIHYQKDFGSRSEHTVKPIIYYNYQSPKINFYIGHIPRLKVLPDVHGAALSDTFLYDRPNLEGLMFHYKSKLNEQKIFVDWTSKQTEEHREQFLIGWMGKTRMKNFYFSNDLLLWHNALVKNSDEDQHVQDNGMLMARAGYDFSDKLLFDSLTLDAGILMGMDRVRTEYDFRFTKGFISHLYMGYKAFSLKNTLYLGQGHNLPNGDKHYTYDKYDRVDLGWSPFRSKAVEAQLLLSLHFVPNYTSSQQTFTLKYNFGQKIW